MPRGYRGGNWDREDKIIASGCGLGVVFMWLVWLCIIGGLIYVALHFLVKVW